MKKQNLPLSPHLQIYKPQITSLLSISHRITGFSLNFSILFSLIGLLSVSLGERTFYLFLLVLESIPFKIIIFLSVIGFTYHFLNGVRHICWDFGYFLETKSSTILGYLILFLSITLSIVIAFLLGLFS